MANLDTLFRTDGSLLTGVTVDALEMLQLRSSMGDFSLGEWNGSGIVFLEPELAITALRNLLDDLNDKDV